MTYGEIKKQRDDDTNKLFNDLGVFWAFSNEQFKEGLAKCNLQDGDKIVDIGSGGYIKKSNFEKLIAGMKAIKKTFTKATKDAKIRTQHILYELNNHECFYSGSIDDAMDVLGEDYTREEVTEVYKNYKTKKNSK